MNQMRSRGSLSVQVLGPHHGETLEFSSTIPDLGVSSSMHETFKVLRVDTFKVSRSRSMPEGLETSNV